MPATSSSMRKEVAATLKRLETKDPGLKKFLGRAHGYAVFPSVGKADAVIGGAYGRGLVFERGKPIGYATIAQMTLGVQLGGDTFSEVIAFESEQSLDRFKRGKIAFAANASAVLVKAGAAASADYEKGCAVFVYASGGMMIEAAIGGQKFKFKPLADAENQGDEEDEGQEDEERRGGGGGARGARGQRAESDEGEDDQGDSDEGEDDEASNLFDEGGVLSRAAGGVKNAGSKVADLVKEHPVTATLIGLGIVGGIAILAASSLKSTSSGSSDSDEADEQEDEDTSARDEADESDEDEEERVGSRARASSEEDEDDEGQEEEDEESTSPRAGASRHHRGR